MLEHDAERWLSIQKDLGRVRFRKQLLDLFLAGGSTNKSFAVPIAIMASYVCVRAAASLFAVRRWRTSAGLPPVRPFAAISQQNKGIPNLCGNGFFARCFAFSRGIGTVNLYELVVNAEKEEWCRPLADEKRCMLLS
jgi:hypothetical protein